MSKFIKHLDSGKLVQVIDDVNKMVEEFKLLNVKMSKTGINDLLNAKRETVNGCTLVDMTEAGDQAGDQQKPADAGTTAPAPAAGDQPPAADNKPQQLTPEPGTAAPAAKTTTPRARATIKAAAPKGKIKPVRKSTKIADGLEMLLAGATVAELEAKDLSDDIVDFVNRRVTKRGYGVKLEDGKVFLVLPEGVKGITYTGGTEEVAPAADVKADGDTAGEPTKEGAEE